MKKALSLLIISWFIFISGVNGKSSVPKQKSIEIGYRNVFNSTFENKASSGMAALFDYAWQLSGIDGKSRASYISVPLGYSMLTPNTNSDRLMKILYYGWTVRHEITYDNKIIPYIGYALLLNQLSFDETEGKVFGHQTKFEVGVNFKTVSYVMPFIKIEYSFTRYPSIGDANSNKIHMFEIKGGIRF